MNPRTPSTPSVATAVFTAWLALASGPGCDRQPAAAPAGDHAGHADHDAHGDQDDHGDHGDHGAHSDHDDASAHVDEVRLTAEALAAYGVRTAAVERRVLAGQISAPARLGFNQEAMAHVAALLPGRIDRIHARVGDRVAAGDVLVTVRSPELGQLQADFLAALSAAQAARPAVDLARDGAERARALLESAGGITQTAVQEREATLAQARRELDAAEARVAGAANALRLHGVGDGAIEEIRQSQRVAPLFEVTAPIAGEVIEKHATPGELVGPRLDPDQEPLLVLADLSTVWAGIDVPEARVGAIGVGSPVTLALPALAGREIHGRVAYVDPRVEAGSRSVRLRMEVDNANGELRPGMFAEARVGPRPSDAGGGDGGDGGDGAGDAGVLAVPASAVLRVEGEDSVFVPVEGEPNTFARRAVSVGPRSGDLVPVIAGLREGEQVVVSGAFILKADLGKAGAEHAH